MNLKLVIRNSSYSQKVYDMAYSAEVERRIRERYSLSAELAILRQRDEKTEEFEDYYCFAEKCKADVKAEFLEAASKRCKQ